MKEINLTFGGVKKKTKKRKEDNIRWNQKKKRKKEKDSLVWYKRR